MSTDNITATSRLIGHDCPLGRYPSVLVPVVAQGTQLFVAYSGPAALVEIPSDALFVRHGDQTAAALSGFDYEQHRLFGFAQDDITLFREQNAPVFFAKLLGSRRAAELDVFYALSLAVAARSPRLVARQLHTCAQRMNRLDPKLGERWYARTATQLAMSTPGLALPTSLRDAVDGSWTRWTNDAREPEASAPAKIPWKGPNLIRWAAGLSVLAALLRREVPERRERTQGSRGTAAWVLRRFVSDILASLIDDIAVLSAAVPRRIVDEQSLTRIGEALRTVADDSHQLSRAYLSSDFSRRLEEFGARYDDWVRNVRFDSRSQRQEPDRTIRDLRQLRHGLAAALRQHARVLLVGDLSTTSCLGLVETLGKSLPESGFGKTREAITRMTERLAREKQDLA